MAITIFPSASSSSLLPLLANRFPGMMHQQHINSFFRGKGGTSQIVKASGNTVIDMVPETTHIQELRHSNINASGSSFFLIDLDPATAKLAIGVIGPFLSAFGFLFILRIVMSWYPKLPVGKFPYVLAYAPTEPILVQTRKIIPPLGGVDVTPVVWFGLLSFLNEILVGPQGLLVLISQQT